MSAMARSRQKVRPVKPIPLVNDPKVKRAEAEAVSAKLYAEDLKAAKKAVVQMAEANLVALYRGRDRNEAWWKEAQTVCKVLF
jgi:hypothetical protein